MEPRLRTYQIAAALDAIAESTSLAESAFSDFQEGDQYCGDDAEYHLQNAYTQLLILVEAQNLPHLRREVRSDLSMARTEGFLSDVSDERSFSAHLKWAVPVRRYLKGLQTTFGVEPSRTVTKDLDSILRAATYSLCDKKIFDAPPCNEATLHLRMEGILRCFFPDLQHKPRITKPIKQFEPDTGIPSIQTLIEYKFLSSQDQLAAISEEILADTRGYHSREWAHFIYVIYETSRIQPESRWNQLMRECAVDLRTTRVIVLSGEAPAAQLEKADRNRKGSPKSAPQTAQR